MPLGVIPTKQQVLINNFSANIHRALSRLKGVFVTLNTADSGQYKETDNFFHPIAVKLNDGYGVQDEHSFQIQIGSKTMPEYTMSSVTETLYQLGKTLVIRFISMVAGIVLINILLDLIWRKLAEQVLLG